MTGTGNLFHCGILGFQTNNFAIDFPACCWWTNQNPQPLEVVYPIVHDGFYTCWPFFLSGCQPSTVSSYPPPSIAKAYTTCQWEINMTTIAAMWPQVGSGLGVLGWRPSKKQSFSFEMVLRWVWLHGTSQISTCKELTQRDPELIKDPELIGQSGMSASVVRAFPCKDLESRSLKTSPQYPIVSAILYELFRACSFPPLNYLWLDGRTNRSKRTQKYPEVIFWI